MIEIAGIFIKGNKAYLPVLGKTEVDYFHDTDHLIITDLTIDSITSSLEEIIKLGNPSIKHPTQAEFQKTTKVQKALKIYSYKKMAQLGVMCCAISWRKNNIGLAFTARDAKDVRAIDYAHELPFPVDTPIRTIVEAIFAEIQARAKTEREGD